MVRKLIFWLCIPVLLAVLSFVATTAPVVRSRIANVTGQPVVDYPEQIDLGPQELGQVAVAPLVIANRGRSTLVVDGIGSTCSCSGLERQQGRSFVPVRQFQLSPGEQTSLQVRVSVNGKAGDSLRTSVGFRTNDPDRPLGRIDVMVGKITGGLVTTPRVVDFGTVLTGSEARQVVEVRDQEPVPRSVESVTSSNPDLFSVRWLPAEPRERAARDSEGGVLLGRFKVSLAAREPGPLEGSVDLQLAGRHPTTVSLLGRVASLIEVSPSRLILPRSSTAGDVWFGTCLCRSNEQLPISLAPDAGDASLAVQVSAVEGSPHLQMVRVEWRPSVDGRPTSDGQRTVRLTARVGSRTIPIQIPVTCRLKEKF
jgi:hypothetical protein